MAKRTACDAARGLAGTAALLALACGSVRAQQPPTNPAQPPTLTVPPVNIIGASPLLGSGVDRDTVPAETNVLKGDDLTRGGTTTPDAVRALNEQVGGVNLDSASGNPYQPTLVYHGFEASALQGTPQGLAVYVNGVRFNQAFGDTVNFDLLPDLAIDQMNLEGSNPVFGLNALGGALNVQLKNGFTYQGGEISRPGRLVRHVRRRFPVRQAERQHRGLCRGERHAPGRLARSAILRIWRISTAISAGAATPESCISTSCWPTRVLNGPGTSPVQLLAADPAAQFTGPNQISNRFMQVSLSGNVAVSDTISLQAVAYYNNFLQRVANGNAPNDTPCNDGSGLLCSDPGVPSTTLGAATIPAFLGREPVRVFGTGQPDDEHQRLRRVDPGHRHADRVRLQQPSGRRRQLRRRADRIHRRIVYRRHHPGFPRVCRSRRHHRRTRHQSAGAGGDQ